MQEALDRPLSFFIERDEARAVPASIRLPPTHRIVFDPDNFDGGHDRLAIEQQAQLDALADLRSVVEASRTPRPLISTSSMSSTNDRTTVVRDTGRVRMC